MKYALFLGSALALAATCAHAEYVCEVSLSPAAAHPTEGKYGSIDLVTSVQPNCGGASKPALICSAGSTDAACGVHAQFSEAALNTLYTSIHDAQMRQQQVGLQGDLCNGFGNDWSCRDGVIFRGP